MNGIARVHVCVMSICDVMFCKTMARSALCELSLSAFSACSEVEPLRQAKDAEVEIRVMKPRFNHPHMYIDRLS